MRVQGRETWPSQVRPCCVRAFVFQDEVDARGAEVTPGLGAVARGADSGEVLRAPLALRHPGAPRC